MLNRNLGKSFSNIGDEYDKYRLDYPEELVDYVVSKIPSSAKLLEIGAGTGIASVMFAKKNFSLSLVEPSEDLLNIAKKKLREYKVSYHQNKFEKADLPTEAFDLVYSAQAFHWVHPKVGFEKVHGLLRQGGHFAVFWNIYYNEESELLTQIKCLYDKHCPDYNMGEGAKIVERLLDSKLFKDGEKREFERIVKTKKEIYIGMVKTFSWVTSLSPEKKLRFIDDLEHTMSEYPDDLEIPYKTLFCIAEKK